MAIKNWNITSCSPQAVQQLCKGTGLPQLVCEVLLTRGYDTAEKVTAFLAKETLYDPFLMKDMDKAVEVLSGAIEDFKKIVVYGDYDCDGITSTALLFSYLENVGANVTYYIPDRNGEGYGMNKQAIQSLHKHGTELIITVDNGVSSIEEVEYANSLGMQVIITDHHTPRDTLPQAAAVVNPHRSDCTYPNKNLSGVGVAFKLVCAMEGDVSCEETLFAYSHLAAIGTVADIVELKGENRMIVKQGLEELQSGGHAGTDALLEVAGLAGKPLDSTALAFGVAPRINAAGRMGQTYSALDLLLTDDPSLAQELAEEVSAYNQERKDVETHILAEIQKMLEQHPSILNNRVLVLWGENWHHGVIGIIASKIVDKYAKPCMLISVQDGEARGSGRSVEGYSMIDAITRCSQTLTRYGGHPLAAGVSLAPENLEQFNAQIQEDAKGYFDEMPTQTLQIDGLLESAHLTVPEVEALSMLEPFGAGNPLPLFAFVGVKVEGIAPLGEGKHIRLQLSDAKGKRFQVLYFGMKPQEFSFRVGDVVDVAATVSLNTFNGSTGVSVKLKDIHLHGIDLQLYHSGCQLYDKYKRKESLPLEQVVPTREDVAKVYRLLKSGLPNTEYDAVWSRLQELGYCKVHLVVDILAELALVQVQQQGGKERITVMPAAGKVDLESSAILTNLKKWG